MGDGVAEVLWGSLKWQSSCGAGWSPSELGDGAESADPQIIFQPQVSGPSSRNSAQTPPATMPNTSLKRRRTEDRMRGKVPKKEKPKIKRQKYYHSSSEDDSDDEGAARDAPREEKKPD